MSLVGIQVWVIAAVIWIFIGGHSNHVYKLESGVWTRLPDMKHHRWLSSCARMRGEIFVRELTRVLRF